MTAAAGFLALVAFFTLGLMRYMVAIARGEPANIAHLFEAGPLVVTGAVTFALLCLGTVTGMVFLVVPGVIFFLFFCLAPYMLLDQKTPVMEAFGASSRAMRGNKLTVLLIWARGHLCRFSDRRFLPVGWAACLPTRIWRCWEPSSILSVTGQATAADSAAQNAPERPFGTSGIQPTV